ncbi:hypothetical protein [Nocardioides sp. LHG3406-4]|uniref:hypothetical protein n=1 Tax=Nocardioides sp. LHG3406-4 TaxID=2804575 RepID=UPI003CE68D23
MRYLTRRPSRAATRGLTVLLDQATSSLSNFLFLLLMARSSNTRDFGAFVLVFTVFTFALSLSRSSLGIPLNTDLSALEGEEAREFLGRSIAVALAFGSTVGVAVGLVAWILAPGGSPSTAMLILAVASPLLVAQDIGRYVNIGGGTPGRALASDSLWLVVLALGYVWFIVTDAVSPTAAVAVWVGGALLALLALLPSLVKPIVKGTGHWFRRDRRRRHLLWDAAIAAAAPLIVVAVTAVVVSSIAVGTIRGASALLTPINVLISAVGMGAVAEAARHAWPVARRLVVGVTVVLVAVTVLWAGILLALPASWGQELLGETWEPAHRLLPVTALEVVGLSLWQGSIALMLTGGYTKLALRFRMAYAAGVITLACTAGVIVGSALSVQLSMTTVTLVIAASSWFAALRLTKPAGRVAGGVDAGSPPAPPAAP